MLKAQQPNGTMTASAYKNTGGSILASNKPDQLDASEMKQQKSHHHHHHQAPPVNGLSRRQIRAQNKEKSRHVAQEAEVAAAAAGGGAGADWTQQHFDSTSISSLDDRENHQLDGLQQQQQHHHHQQQQQQQQQQNHLKDRQRQQHNRSEAKPANLSNLNGKLDAPRRAHLSGGGPASGGVGVGEPSDNAANGPGSQSTGGGSGGGAAKLPKDNNNSDQDQDKHKVARDHDDEQSNERQALEGQAAKPQGGDDDGAQQEATKFKTELVWTNIILFIILHSAIPIGLYQIYTQKPWLTLAWSIFWAYTSGFGVTAGTHRLWSHKSYKAHRSVEVFLMLLQTLAGQNSIYIWSRDHRVHHKFSETNADPHNIKRGFFFAHMGWLCCRKHPDVKTKGKLIDMSDLEANPVVMFQLRHFWWLSILINLMFPTLVPYFMWNERLGTSLALAFGIRYLITLHFTWLVNSAAHYYGSRPYDSRIEARESPFVILNGLGEGFHNYHHTFPFDYSTSEFGRYFNLTTAFIDLCHNWGLASDRRKVDRSIVLRRQLRTGDGTQLPDEAAVEATEKNANEQQPQKSNDAAHAQHLRRTRPANGAPSGQQQQQLDMIHELPYISGLTSVSYTM